MPPRKTAKNNRSATVRKTKRNVKQSFKIQPKNNSSATRFLKSKSHSIGPNVNYPADFLEVFGFKDYKEEGEESYNLSPAYLCECTLQTSAAPEASEIKPADEHPLNKFKLPSNLSKKKKPPSKKIKKNSENDGFSPAFLCESILKVDALPGITIESISKDELQRTKQSSNENRNASEIKPADEYPLNKFKLPSNLSKNKKPPSKKINKNKNNEYDGFSPAFLCESVLKVDALPGITIESISKDELQRTKLSSNENGNASEIKPADEYPLNKFKFPSNLSKNKKPPSKKININKNNENDKFSPAFLCESILEVDALPGITIESISKDEIQRTKQSSNENRNKGNFNNSYQEYRPKHQRKRKFQSKDTQVVLEPDYSSANSVRKKSRDLDFVEEVNLGRSRKNLKINKEYNLNLGINPILLCESVIQSEEAPVILESNLTNKRQSKVNSQIKRKPQRRSKKAISNDLSNLGMGISMLNHGKNNAKTSLVSESNSLLENYPKTISLKRRSQKKINNLGHSRKNLKMNKENNLNLGIDPILLCESVIQSEEAPVILESNLTNKRQSKVNSQIKRKSQRRSRKATSDDLSNLGMGNSTLNHRKNNVKTSLVSESNSLLENYPQTISFNRRSRKKIKNLGHSRKNLKMNKENNLNLGIDPILLCESVIQSEEAPVTLESNLTNKRHSKVNSQIKRKPQRRSRKAISNDLSNLGMENSMINHRKNNVKTSLVSESNYFLENYPKTKSLNKRSLKKIRFQQNPNLEAYEINDKYLKSMSSNINRGTKEHHTSVISESHPSMDYYMKKDILETKSPCKVSLRQRRKKPTCNSICCQAQDHKSKQLCKSTVQSKVTTAVSGYDHSLNIFPKNNSRDSHSKNKKKAQNSKLKSGNNIIINRDSLRNLIENSTLTSNKTSTSSESMHLYRCSSKDLVPQNNDLEKNKLHSCSKDNALNHINQDLLSLDPKSSSQISKKETTMILKSDEDNHEKNKAAKAIHISSACADKHVSQFKEITTECDNSHDYDDYLFDCDNSFDFDHNTFDCDSETSPSDKRQINKEYPKNLNGKPNEICFVGSDLINGLTFNDTLVLDEDESEINGNKVEEDPLECHLKDFNASGSNHQLIHHKEDNTLENENIHDSNKATEFVNDTIINPLLKLECNLESSKSLDTPEVGYDLKENFKSQSNVLSNDLKILESLRRFSLMSLELKYDFQLMPTCPPKSESQALNDNSNKEVTKCVTNIGDVTIIIECKENITSNASNILSKLNETQTEEKHSLQCLGLPSSLFDLGESIYESSSKILNETESNNSFGLVDSENNVEIGLISEHLSPEMVEPKPEDIDSCLFKDKGCPMKIEDGLSMSSPLPIYSDGGCKNEDDCAESSCHLDWNINMNCSSGEILPVSENMKDSKEMKKFHEERDPKVVLRRLEDEEIFKVWKENGVISLSEHPRSNGKLLQKKIILGRSLKTCQKKMGCKKGRKSFKCGVCKMCFKNRDRYWEHRASKCDRVRVFGCGNCNRKYILKKMLDEHRKKCISIKYYRCQRCMKLFNSQERLDEHNATTCDTQKAFECDVCGREFIFKRLFLIHTTPICTSLRHYKCSICLQSFHQADLKAHKLKVHGIGLRSSDLCEFCGKLVSHRHFSLHILQTHTSHPLYRCTECTNTFLSKEARNYHYEQHHIDTKPCVCADCGRAFRSLKLLKKHVIGFGKLCKCNTCGKVIRNQFCLRAHKQKHVKTEVPNNELLTCQIKLEPVDDEPFHDLQHSPEEKPSKCIECDEIFTEGIALQHHLQSVHQATVVEIKTEQSQGSSINIIKLLKCENCTSCFPNERDLIHHLQNSHCSHSGLKPTVEDKPFKCETCGSSFKYKMSLNRHCRRVHNAPTFVRGIVKTPTEEKPYACRICGICFRNKIYLNRHCRRVHNAPTSVREIVKTPTEEKPYACRICGICFRNKIYLNRHCRRVHKVQPTIVKDIVTAPTEEKPYACEICGLFFKIKYSVNRHCRLVHKAQPTIVKDIGTAPTEDKPCACEICGICFIRKDNLNRHCRRVHKVQPTIVKDIVTTPTEEKPYPCHACGMCFGNKKNLSRHHKRMHLVNTAQPDSSSMFPCEFCPEVFKTKALLQEHTLKHLQDGFSVKTIIKEEVNSFASTDSKSIRSNIVTPAQEKMFICDICGNRFGEKKNLTNHRRRAHKIYASNTSYNCSFCNKTFKTDAELESHTFNHFKKGLPSTSYVNVEGNVATPDVEKEDSSFSDSNFHRPDESLTIIGNIKDEDVVDSGEVTGTHVALSHLENQSGRLTILQDHEQKIFACAECGKSFHTEYSLAGHVCLHKLNSLQSTVGRELHTCEECGVIFVDRWRLNRHLLSHSSQTYKCDVCKKCFTTQVKLNVHMLVHGTKTTAEPTFKCSICNKLFPSSEKLKKHSIFHTEQNPYQCTKCEKKFTTLFSLKRHDLNTHGHKCFSCNYCNMAFVSFSSLNQHVMSVHKKTVSLTEYILKLDEDLQDQTTTETDNMTLYNLQGENITEVNVQPQVYANLNNLMFSNVLTYTPGQSEKRSDLQNESFCPNVVTYQSSDVAEFVNL